MSICSMRPTPVAKAERRCGEIVNDRDTDGRICLETSSADLKKYNHWTFLPAEYLFCRLSTREELRDFSFNLNRN